MSKTLNLLSAANDRRRLAASICLSSLGLFAVAALPQQPTISTTANASSIMVAKPAELQKCVGCHGANLKGRKGFSPGITSSGVLKEYNKTTFEVVMNTGKTNDGGMVKPPMPVFHEKKSVSDAMYAYLKTQK